MDLTEAEDVKNRWQDYTKELLITGLHDLDNHSIGVTHLEPDILECDVKRPLRNIIRKLWYIYTMEYYSAIKKNTFESVLVRWMKLEPIIQSEVSQKEKHQHSILTRIYGI